jgi:UDP-N-acetylmuramate--alanine ligase
MLESEANPTAHIGGILPAINDSTIIGTSNIFITEACEYVESFLKFNPYLAVILNIEADHLDYFKDLSHVKDSFCKFIGRIKKDGFLVANIDDENVTNVLNTANCNVITYGISNPKAFWQARDITFDEFGCPTYSVYSNNSEYMRLTLKVPGLHNVSNSLAAIAACVSTSNLVNPLNISKAFEKFKGANRRFELKGFVDGIRVIDDYAHHPTEITATLSAAREGHSNRIISVFQPHTYTRTKSLLNEFSKSFENSDIIVITDIYAAREKDPGDIHASSLAEMLEKKGKNVMYISSFDDIVKYLDSVSTRGDLIITMGAGNIDNVADMFIDHKFTNAVFNL